MESYADSFDFVSITDCLKATPRIDGGQRFIYIEASNEHPDFDGETVLAKALEESAPYYLKYGNLDIDHYTLIGAKQGIPNYELFEIGRPVDVVVKDQKTFVKGRVFSGAGPAAEKANAFWSSMTEINPPARWYPSVGGQCARKQIKDEKSGLMKSVVHKVVWNNIGFSKTPVNLAVPTVATVPFGALAKSWVASQGGYDLAKALQTTSNGVTAPSDSAGLTGGAAFRVQSLEGSPLSYFHVREDLARALRTGAVGRNPGSADMIDFVVRAFGTSRDEAAEIVERFMRDIATRRKK